MIIFVSNFFRVLPGFVSLGFEGSDALLQHVVVCHLLEETGVELPEGHRQRALGVHLNQSIQLRKLVIGAVKFLCELVEAQSYRAELLCYA